jgi:hypothetical protein
MADGGMKMPICRNDDRQAKKDFLIWQRLTKLLRIFT